MTQKFLWKGSKTSGKYYILFKVKYCNYGSSRNIVQDFHLFIGEHHVIGYTESEKERYEEKRVDEINH